MCTYSPIETELAYLAGILDSDGCIFITRRSPDKSRRYISVVHSAIIVIAQIHPEALELFSKCFGGKIHNYTPQSRETFPHRRPLYRLTISSSQQTGKCIRALLPYLRLKLPQAHLALQLVELREQHRMRQSKTFGVAIPIEEMQKRDKLWEEMRDLNTSNGKGHHRPQKCRLFS